MLNFNTKVRLRTEEEMTQYFIDNIKINKELARTQAKNILNHRFLKNMKGREFKAFIHSNGDAQIDNKGFSFEVHEYIILN